jgi:hypothetical protein
VCLLVIGAGFALGMPDWYLVPFVVSVWTLFGVVVLAGVLRALSAVLWLLGG